MQLWKKGVYKVGKNRLNRLRLQKISNTAWDGLHNNRRCKGLGVTRTVQLDLFEDFLNMSVSERVSICKVILVNPGDTRQENFPRPLVSSLYLRYTFSDARS